MSGELIDIGDRGVSRAWMLQLSDGRRIHVPEVTPAQMEDALTEGLALRTVSETLVNGRHVITAEPIG